MSIEQSGRQWSDLGPIKHEELSNFYSKDDKVKGYCHITVSNTLCQFVVEAESTGSVVCNFGFTFLCDKSLQNY